MANWQYRTVELSNTQSGVYWTRKSCVSDGRQRDMPEVFEQAGTKMKTGFMSHTLCFFFELLVLLLL